MGLQGRTRCGIVRWSCIGIFRVPIKYSTTSLDVNASILFSGEFFCCILVVNASWFIITRCGIVRWSCTGIFRVSTKYPSTLLDVDGSILFSGEFFCYSLVTIAVVFLVLLLRGIILFVGLV